LNTEKVLFSFGVKNKELIGRVFSSQYEFEGGHLYFGDNIIKIRYDVLEERSGHVLHRDPDLLEEQIFDYYDNIVEL
jgi:hypothetical protein